MTDNVPNSGKKNGLNQHKMDRITKILCESFIKSE